LLFHRKILSHMRLFLDTEFTDLLDCELLSIGIVSEDGQEFYAERNDVDLARCGDFARVAVVPQLGQAGAFIGTEAEVSSMLRRWLERFEGRVDVCVDHPTDWELFVYLARDPETLEKPGDIRGQSVRNLVDPRDVEAYWTSHGRRAHHALHDARALKFGYDAASKRADSGKDNLV